MYFCDVMLHIFILINFINSPDDSENNVSRVNELLVSNFNMQDYASVNVKPQGAGEKDWGGGGRGREGGF